MEIEGGFTAAVGVGPLELVPEDTIAVKDTLPENWLEALTLIVEELDCPTITGRGFGFAER
jgi:hypothetical protein